jgi:hypothetical protein
MKGGGGTADGGLLRPFGGRHGRNLFEVEACSTLYPR